jgi:LAS superfamily LD-carboxypeptidase LdcB
VDGITNTSQRIAEIRALIGGLTAVPSAQGARASAAQFDAALSDAVGQLDATTSRGSGARNAQGVPADLAVYGNGRIPREALDEVGKTGHKLSAPAGQALEQLLTAAARDGVEIGITDSYRSYDAQVDVARRKGLYRQGGLAAAPGTSSHGWGVAVDLDLDDKAQAWMRSRAGRFGFVEDTPREPWHWVFKV